MSCSRQLALDPTLGTGFPAAGTVQTILRSLSVQWEKCCRLCEGQHPTLNRVRPGVTRRVAGTVAMIGNGHAPGMLVPIKCRRLLVPVHTEPARSAGIPLATVWANAAVRLVRC